MEDIFAEKYTNVTKDFCDDSNEMEYIDVDTWDRKRLFFNYLGTDFPYIIMTSDVDVTKPLEFAHKHGLSFNLVMIYLCNQVADSIRNYRYRFVEDRPFIIKHTRPTMTHLLPGSDIFVMVEGPWPVKDIFEFCRVTKERQQHATQEEMQGLVRYKLDLIQYSSIPWVRYTAFIRTIIHNGVDNAPKISFGKYYRDPLDPAHTLMPVSSQTHHGLMDGKHVGLFYMRLQEACDKLEV